MLSDTFTIDLDLRQTITANQAFHYRIVPVSLIEGELIFLTDSKNMSGLTSELEIILDSRIRLEFCEPEKLQNYLTANYRQSDNTRENLTYTADFLEKILYTAKEIGSSDIHFEPYEEFCRVRFRLDGKLIEQYVIPKNEYPVIINKIKIKADLDIAEKRLPQDGRISMKSEIDEFDIRVSSLPTLFGEKIVLRILTKQVGAVDIEKLGFSEEELRVYKEAIRKPNGIILISGPTGSGKTTTLYATLQLLNTPETNIYTIEDPIEYTLEGVNQVQVKENIGFDFSKALRTFLRQDPNIIMVGEIRDIDTANMAIRTALIGRLVLSTIHTNSAWSTISRLVDMGIPPFLIATTLNVSVAQRLVRKLCENCKKKEAVADNIFPESFVKPKSLTHHYNAVGCPKCYHTGYKGRKAIYEIIPITRELVTYIRENVTHIEEYLHQNKIVTLRKNALQMIEDGITSVDEVYALLTN
ncbi:GspE/PulE family protein [Costertonia aggregata]|uniref:Type II/IV secretion system protein n=1 Tax=Costertonia aggregata TaxID=343403 RepID=A0A7H9ATV0_9FLAO|nr:GspE/PulE family protein [Costertonia aggregata]QLG46772.1 type II/IV secretion system protein [Costertonia aggregata]